MGHDHGTASTRAGARHARRLWTAFGLTVAFLLVQVAVGVVTGSLAVLSDAGHMATDALGLGMALAAITAANRTVHARHRTFGLYRLEILAALANAALLFLVAGYVLVEAARRLGVPPQIEWLPVFVVGVIGLCVNCIAFALLRPGAAESLNVRGAYYEVVADMLGSLDVISAALSAIDGVNGVHDLHVWTLTSDMDVLTAHIAVDDGGESQVVLHRARTVLAEQFRLSHATLQVETAGDHRCDEMTW